MARNIYISASVAAVTYAWFLDSIWDGHGKREKYTRPVEVCMLPKVEKSVYDLFTLVMLLLQTL